MKLKDAAKKCRNKVAGKTITEYTRKIWWYTQGKPLTYGPENYTVHWKYTSFKDKTILDLGADLGSTAKFFLKNGAAKIIAVEGNSKYAKQLTRNFQKSHKVVCLEQWIKSAEDVSSLIEKFRPDIVKMDIEGYEKTLLNLPTKPLLQVKEWLIETHTNNLCTLIRNLLLRSGFQVGTVEYGKACGVPHIRVLVAYRKT